MRDWHIITDSDRITAAKMYDLYGKANRECSNGGRFKVQSMFEDFVKESQESEKITAHPYVKYQKARILQLIDKSRILPEPHTDEVRRSYLDAIYIIKTVDQYSVIQNTKSYAALLWLYGQFLADQNNLQDSIRYLEEAKSSFESQSIMEQQYYQCLTLLGRQYLKCYLDNRGSNLAYLRRARNVSRSLQEHSDDLGRARKHANALRNELQKYGTS